MIASRGSSSLRSFVEVDGARIGLREIGTGPAILATHGFSETGDYWFCHGVADALARHSRFISIDMRGHGRTVEPADRPGFDVDTLANDIESVANALDLPSFVLLGHATGSVVACRYAMRASVRLRGLVLTSAASATAMMSSDPSENIRFFGRLAKFYSDNDWDGIMSAIKAKPWPFLHQLDKAPNACDLWNRIEAVFRANDPSRLGAFVRAFYRDPDPQIDRLKRVRAPTLVIHAEHDELMREPARVIADNIPDCRLRYLAGVGHMTALECPARLVELLDAFLVDGADTAHVGQSFPKSRGINHD